MKLNVEFLGVARQLAQTKGYLVEVPDQATYRDVLRSLAAKHPALIGPVIIPKTFDLVRDMRLTVDGLHSVSNLEALPQDGQQITLMFEDIG